MSLYSHNWAGFLRVLTPRNKRKSKILAFLGAVISVVDYLYTRTIKQFFQNGLYIDYSGAETYEKYDVVKYGFNVYECIVSSSNGVVPANTTNWRRLQNNYKGAFERSKILSGRISLEKYLNDFYTTSFNYPSSSNAIYISTNSNDITQQYSSPFEKQTSKVTDTGGASRYFTGSSFSVYSQNNFTIYVPLAVWTAIDTTDSKREGQVKNLIINYVPSGLTFNVTSY
jgi:hypothetical protein